MCSDFLTKNLPGALFERHICPFAGDDEYFVCEEKSDSTLKHVSFVSTHICRLARDTEDWLEELSGCSNCLRFCLMKKLCDNWKV